MRFWISLVAIAGGGALGGCASAPAASANDLRELGALTNCYADGIDAIGAGKAMLAPIDGASASATT